MKDQELIKRWIEPSRQHPGAADARIVQTGIPVWTLVGYSRAAKGDLAWVAADYHLPIDAARAAIACYTQHREVLDARLAANAIEVV